jgi:hypothetical protein
MRAPVAQSKVEVSTAVIVSKTALSLPGTAKVHALARLLVPQRFQQTQARYLNYGLSQFNRTALAVNPPLIVDVMRYEINQTDPARGNFGELTAR